MDVDRRLLGADFVRACACLVVVFHHLVQRMGFSADFTYLGWLQIFGVIGGLGVAMFFVLSGFLLARPFWQALERGEPMPSLKVYALRRGARIIPGFWLALTVTFVLSFAVFGFPLDGWLWLRYGAGLLLVSDWHWTTLFPVELNGPLWSIGFEVTAYVLMPLGFWLVFRAARRVRNGLAQLALWLGVIALALGAHWLFANLVQVDQVNAGWDHGLQGGAKAWMPRINPFSMFAIFAIGALTGGLQVRLARYRHGLFDALALLALMATGWTIWQVFLVGSVESFAFLDVPYAFPWLPLALGTMLAVTPSTVLIGLLLDNRAVRYLAQISFGIYVWHYLAIELIAKFVFPQLLLGAHDQTLFITGTLAVIAISIFIADLSYRKLERPVINWARGLEKKTPHLLRTNLAAER
ncbi:peptidoglycan/LPS O-acetylase OafA/YrhL [Devosia sp. UYZn731]|uniref:acyltransferase family protein n=1 Tax=Devosia sp. UYZn731 TaxID=3156345 RepID=UPI0033964E4C